MSISTRFITMLLLWSLFHQTGHGQAVDFNDRRAFFNQQTENFQDWLSVGGFDKTLRTEYLKITPDTLFLYLAFTGADYDYNINAIRQLRKDVAGQSSMTLEEKLFYKAAYFYEIPEHRLVIQLFDNYREGAAVLYWMGVYFAKGTVTVEESEAKPILKSIRVDAIDISESQYRAARGVSDLSYSKADVFEKAFQFLKEKYDRELCAGTKPKVHLRESQRRLWVQVDNLCKEALYDQTNNVLCRILERLDLPSCNTIKRERFYFMIDYEPDDKGFELIVEIDGEYSDNYLSGYGQYKKMDYRFMEYFQLYADALAEDLRRAVSP